MQELEKVSLNKFKFTLGFYYRYDIALSLSIQKQNIDSLVNEFHLKLKFTIELGGGLID